jgi:hypothetical protein
MRNGDPAPDPRLSNHVCEVVECYLQDMDQAAPGLIEGLYLTGSVALADYRPGTSDIDFVALTSRSLEAGELAALGAVHAGLPAAPHLDGVYLDRTAFEAMLDDERVVPHVVAGKLQSDQPCGELNPVLWLTLVRYGIPLRKAQNEVRLRTTDPARVRQWNLANLRSYWRPLAAKIRRALTGQDTEVSVDAAGLVWAALGPARLHYTLTTGDVASKARAGEYAAQRFSTYAPLLERVAASRDGRTQSFTTTDLHAAADLIDVIVTDAWSR